MTSLAASRRQNDGPRRVSFSETRVTSSRLYDDSDEEEDDEERRLLREEEEERALSEKFGEAEEGGGGESSRKRKTEESEKDIALALDQEEKKKIKKPRPQLLPANLTGADGLMKLPIEFKKNIKYRPKKGKKRDIVAAAAYSQNLVNAYHSFCTDLFPSMAFEDVLLKIEQLGSKKEVKDFLQHTRDNVRNEHLERLYGREKAERMLQELDDGLKLREHVDGYDDEMQPQTAMDEDASPEQSNDNPTATTMEGNNATPNASFLNAAGASENQEATTAMSDDEEQEATFDDEDSTPIVPNNNSTDMRAVATAEENDKDADEEQEATFDDEPVDNDLSSKPVEESPPIVPSKDGTAAAAKENDNDNADDEEEDEEEATFDDVMEAQPAAQMEQAAPEKETIPDKDDDKEDQEALDKEDTGGPDVQNVDQQATMSDKTSTNAANSPEDVEMETSCIVEDGESEPVHKEEASKESSMDKVATPEDSPQVVALEGTQVPEDVAAASPDQTKADSTADSEDTAAVGTIQ